jgi:hypothetical protein
MKLNALILSFLLFLTACNNINTSVPENPAALVWSTHDKRPEWVVQGQEPNLGKHYFVGESAYCVSQRCAKEDAYLSAVFTATRYFGLSATEVITIETQSISSESGVADPVTEVERDRTVSVKTALGKMSVDEYYLEQWEDESGRLQWRAYVLTSLPDSMIELLAKRATQS